MALSWAFESEEELLMNSVLRWVVAILGWLVLFFIYGVWKDAERHTGGGFISGFLRGAIVLGGVYFLYRWARSERHQTEQMKPSAKQPIPVVVSCGPVATATLNLETSASSGNCGPIELSPVVDEDGIYAEIAQELESGLINKGLWTRLFAECDGDEKQTRVLYIRQRAERLIGAERIRLERLTHEWAIEPEKTKSSAEKPRTDISLAPIKVVAILSASDIQEFVATASRERIQLAHANEADVSRFFNAIRYGQVTKVRQAVSENPLLVLAKDVSGNTPIDVAQRENCAELLAFFKACLARDA